jgi:hypothetical protein
MVEEWNARSDLRLALAVKVEADGDAGLFGVARDSGLPDLHPVIKTERLAKNKAQLRRQ